MSVDHEGTGGTSPPPEFGAGDANANCPPQILSENDSAVAAKTVSILFADTQVQWDK